MSRNGFRKLKQYFHVCERNSKVAKIQEIYGRLIKNIFIYSVFHKNLSINGSMAPYFGMHNCKIYIKRNLSNMGASYRLLVLMIFLIT